MNRFSSVLSVMGFMCALMAFLTAAQGAPSEVVTSDPMSRPESITVAPDGSVILGSVAAPIIYRAAPGATTATPFIDMRPERAFFVLGVLADGPSNTLWACEFVTFDSRTPLWTGVSILRAFDLQTGAPKGRYPLPGVTNMCNDITVAPDKSVYISDTSNGSILRLRPGAQALEPVMQDPSLYGVDGLTFLGNTLYVNTQWSNDLFRIPLDASGKPMGPPVELYLSQPILAPDAMRAAGGKLFLAENRTGKIDMVTVQGDRATVTTIKSGYGNPTALEPMGDTLWVGDRAVSKAIPIPMPK
jgi:sugar lactone lactonase YvrE